MKVFILVYITVISLVFFNIRQDSKLKESIKRGSEIYENNCITCHQSEGQGLGDVFPPLAKSDYLLNNREKSIMAVKYGLNGEITVNDKKYTGFMAPLGLEDNEVADVLNYVLNSWGNTSDKMVTEEEVTGIKK